MLKKAIKQAAGDKADCVLEIVGHAGITAIDQIWTLGQRTGSVSVCGVNVNVLCGEIVEAYKRLSEEPEPDSLDEIAWPDNLVRHLPKLREGGIKDAQSIQEAGVDGLSALPGIGIKTAELLMEAVGDKEN